MNRMFNPICVFKICRRFWYSNPKQRQDSISNILTWFLIRSACSRCVDSVRVLLTVTLLAQAKFNQHSVSTSFNPICVFRQSITRSMRVSFSQWTCSKKYYRLYTCVVLSPSVFVSRCTVHTTTIFDHNTNQRRRMRRCTRILIQYK